MKARAFPSTLLRGAAAIALVLVPGLASANFNYVPAGQTQQSAGPAPSSAAPVTSMPLNPPTETSRHAGSTSGTAKGGEVISGFGNQVPLVMALRQIVPASYQFAFADGLNLGTLVNWKGGKPWRTVVQSVVVPLGLTAVERNAVIYVDHAGGSGSAPSGMTPSMVSAH